MSGAFGQFAFGVSAFGGANPVMTAPQLAVQLNGQGSVSADNLNTYQQTCDNIAQLRAFVGAPGVQVFVRGTSVINDGGQGNFAWIATGTGPDDGLNVIVPAGGAPTGIWQRLTAVRPVVDALNGGVLIGNSGTFTQTIALAPSDLVAKASPTSADLVVIGDSAAAFAAKKTTIDQLRTAFSGSVQQIVNFETGSVGSGPNIIPFDNTIPQQNEGDQYMSLTLTAINPLNTWLIDVTFIGVVNAANLNMIVALFQDAGANALAVGAVFQATSGGMNIVNFRHKMAVNTGIATTFKVRAGPSAAGTLVFNGNIGGGLFGGTLASSITITETIP
jgi:hypothetical protein